MYKTILVPLDGSNRAERILPHVEQLAQLFGSEVIFLQVIEPDHVLTSQGETFPDLSQELGKQRQDEARSYLTALQGEFRGKGIESKVVVEMGSVPTLIIQVAEQVNANLIAMASHGRGGLLRVFYGSVTAAVLNKVDRPILLVRARR